MNHFYSERLSVLGLVLALINIVFLSLPVGAQEPQAILTCERDGQVIFSSISSDINAFDASQYGAILVRVMLIVEQNTNLYMFSPGGIYCSIPADLDTSTVNL